MQLRWVDIAFADIDTISTFATLNIGDIDRRKPVLPHSLTYSHIFIIACEVVNDVNVFPQLPFRIGYHIAK